MLKKNDQWLGILHSLGLEKGGVEFTLHNEDRDGLAVHEEDGSACRRSQGVRKIDLSLVEGGGDKNYNEKLMGKQRGVVGN